MFDKEIKALLDKLLGYWSIGLLPNNPYPSLVLDMHLICYNKDYQGFSVSNMVSEHKP